MKYLKSLGVLFLSMLIFVACADDAEDDGVGMNHTDNTMSEQKIMPGQEQQTARMGGRTIGTIIKNNENLSTFVKALNSAGLMKMLSDTQSVTYTVFAPTNEAFQNLSEGTLDDFMAPENNQKLTNILQYHIVEGAMITASSSNSQMVGTLAGSDLEISMEEQGNIMVNGVEVEQTVQTSNGVIHFIDEVLKPSS